MEEIKKSEVKSLIDIIEPLDRRRTPGDSVLGDLGAYAHDSDIVFPEGRRDMCGVVCGVRKLGEWDWPGLYQSAYFIYKTEKGLQYEEITIPEAIQKYIEAPGFWPGLYKTAYMKIKSIWEYEKDIYTEVSYISIDGTDRIDKEFRMKLSDLGLEEIDKIG